MTATSNYYEKENRLLLYGVCYKPFNNEGEMLFLTFKRATNAERPSNIHGESAHPY